VIENTPPGNRPEGVFSEAEGLYFDLILQMV
jgi:hypothetical protein